MNFLGSAGENMMGGLGNFGGAVGGIFGQQNTPRLEPKAPEGEAGDAVAQFQRQKKLVTECLGLTESIVKLADTNVSDVPTPRSSGFRTKSTVGIMLNDCAVEGTVVGGPAFISRGVVQGDQILKIDNNVVNAENILQYLVGSDVPGSDVLLDIQKKVGGQTRVKLKRMATALIAPKLKLFDLFTQSKERAMELNDKRMSDLIEGCISTWTEMTIADGEREEKIKSNAAQVRIGCVEQGGELETKLTSMKNLTVDLMASFEVLRKNEALLKVELEEARRKLLGMQDLESKLFDSDARIKELELSLRKSESLNSSLTKEINESQLREVKVRGDYMIASKEAQEARNRILELERKLEQATKQNSKLNADLARKDTELENSAVNCKKIEVEFKASQAKISDLTYEKSKLETLLKESKQDLHASEDKCNTLTAEFEESQKQLKEMEKQFLNTRDDRDKLGLQVQRLERQVKEVEKSLQVIIDDKSEKISQVQADIAVAHKEEALLQKALADANQTTRLAELDRDRLAGQKCALETEVEGNTVRIKTLEIQLREAVSGKVHFQSETDALVPAKDDLQRKLIAAELDLSSSKDKAESLTKENVFLRAQLESEKTSHQEALDCVKKTDEDHKKTIQDLRMTKSDLAQCNTELNTSKTLAKMYEDKLAAANVESNKFQADLRQAILKCDALELRNKDTEDRLAAAVKTTHEQKDEMSNLVDKIEMDEKEIQKKNAEADNRDLRIHECIEREKRLQQEIETLKNSLNIEIKGSAETHSNLIKEQASSRSLERELGDSRNEGYKTVRNLRTVEELEREHVKKISDMDVELVTTRATMKKETAELMQIVVVARLALEQLHHAVIPASPTSYQDVETANLIPMLRAEACAEAQQLHNKIFRLQQQNTTLTEKLAEVEEIRVQIQSVAHSKTKVEMQLSDANKTIEKLQCEISRNKSRMETLDDSLSAAKHQMAVSEKKVHGLQADLDSTIEKHRAQVKELNKEIAHLKEILGDNRQLAEELHRLEEENDTFKKILKASLEAQELTHDALCGGKENAKAGLGLVVQVVNGITKVKTIIPGAPASEGETALQSGDIIEKVDDKTLAGATLSAVQDMFLGSIGSAVNLTFFRSTKPSSRSSSASVAESPRLSVTLRRDGTANSVEAIRQRSRDMVAAAHALRSQCVGLEENVTNLSGTVGRQEVDVTTLRSAREEAVKLINALEQRVRSRDSELVSLRADALRVKNNLHTANLEIESLRLQKNKTDAVISFSQHRIKELEESRQRLELREKELSSKVAKMGAEVEKLQADLQKAEELGRNATVLKRQVDVAERRASHLAEQLRVLQETHELMQQQLNNEQERRSKAESDLVEMIQFNRQLLDAMKGHKEDWQGVGITVMVGKTVIVKEVAESGSAAHSGLLQVGDTLTQCDGKSLAGLSSAQVQNLILGRSGTQVRFMVRPQSGKKFSLVLVRGNHASNFSDELREAIDCTEAMHVEATQLRDLLKDILSQIRIRESDVDRTLRIIDKGIEDARLSWLDVSSSVHAFAIPDAGARKSVNETNGRDTDRSQNNVDVDLNSNRLDATSRAEVESGTQKSRATLARIAEFTMESLIQITDLVKVRAELKESFAKESRIRHGHEETIGKIKKELTTTSRKLEQMSNDYNNAMLERSEAIDFESKIHAILRGKEVEVVGVGMVVKLEGRSTYPVIKSITPGGAAAACTEFCVGDSILTVNGKDVEGMDVQHLTPLFLGPMGSAMTIVAARPSEEAKRDSTGWMSQGSRASLSSLMTQSYTVTLVRGYFASSFDILGLKRDRPESLELARKFAQRYIVVLKQLEVAKEEIDRQNMMIGELKEDLDVRNQQIVALADALETCKLELTTETERTKSLEKELLGVQKGLREATARFEREIKEANEKYLLLKAQILNLEHDIEDLKEKLVQMTKRAKNAEQECADIQTKLELAFEELDVAQATIQGLQSRVDDLTEKLKISEKNLAISEAEKKTLAKELEAANAEIDRLLALLKKLEVSIKELQALIVEKDDRVRELQYKLDLCPYKCKKVAVPKPAPLPEAELEDDPTKYVGVGMVVRVETGKPFPLIKRISPDGSAAECDSLAIDDALLEVDGKDCRGKSVADMTALFLGPVGSSVSVKGHSLADHDHLPTQPSYSVTLIRGKKGQSPAKEVKKFAPVLAAATGPVQTNADDLRLKRSMEEVQELQQQLAAARIASEEVAKRCARLESDANQAALAAQRREVALAAGETQQALDKTTAALSDVQRQLEHKSKQLEDVVNEASALKKTARIAQDEVNSLQQKLSAAFEDLDVLRNHVKDLEEKNASIRSEMESVAEEARPRELAAQAELIKLQDELSKRCKSEKDVTAALRTMSEAERACKLQIQELQSELDRAKAKIKLLQDSLSTSTETHTANDSGTSSRSTKASRPDDDQEDSKASRRSSVPHGGLLGAAASRSFKIAGARPASFSGASPPGSPAASGVGVGMEITNTEPFIVKRLVEDGPARASGAIAIGDTLTAIDDQDISLLHIDIIKAMLVGEGGSQVKLSLLRSSAGDTGEAGASYTVKIVRGTQQSKSKLRLM